MGRDATTVVNWYKARKFQSTLPAWGETDMDDLFAAKTPEFQSTLPAWGETRRRSNTGKGKTYFNPLSPHGERHSERLNPWPTLLISIHSPRMGRDLVIVCVTVEAIYFNPLSPHGERQWHLDGSRLRADFNPLSPHGERPDLKSVVPCAKRFQSTLPAWGETRGVSGGRRGE